MIDSMKPYPLITDAIRRGAKEELTELFEQFPEMWNLEVPAFGTWLHFASAHGTLAIVQYLVERGIDPDCRNSHGRNPAALAAAKGKSDVLDYLLSNGSQIDIAESISNPLFGAILGRSAACVERLLAAGIDTTASYQFGSVPEQLDAISFAVMHGEPTLARLIAWTRSNDPRIIEELLEIATAKAHAVTVAVPRA